MRPFLTILLFFISPYSFAQYAGGKSNGTSQYIASNILLGTNSSYSGGNNDGYQSLTTNLSLATNTSYSGGNDDGFKSVQYSSVSLNSSSSYSGGSDDGFNSSTINLSMNSTSAYAGGKDDGFSGNAFVAISLNAAGTGYSGGNGQGFNSTPALLSLVPLSSMYSGGLNDGFAFAYSIQVYYFVGIGNWDIKTNWFYDNMPPSVLPPGSEIYINPLDDNECILNVPQTISPGAKLIILPGKHLRIPGNVQ